MMFPGIFANFDLAWESWLTIIGMTIILVSINYMLFRVYQNLSLSVNRMALISGLGFMSLVAEFTWVFTVGLITY